MRHVVPTLASALTASLLLTGGPDRSLSEVNVVPDNVEKKTIPVKLNTPAAEILRRCDGRRSVDQIVGELELAFDRTALRDDVRTFIDQALQRGWLR